LKGLELGELAFVNTVLDADGCVRRHASTLALAFGAGFGRLRRLRRFLPAHIPPVKIREVRLLRRLQRETRASQSPGKPLRSAAGLPICRR
jgi:hypothetical protein